MKGELPDCPVLNWLARSPGVKIQGHVGWPKRCV